MNEQLIIRGPQLKNSLGIDELRDARVASILNDTLPAGASILEISCGPAALLSQLHTSGYVVRGTNFTDYPDAAKDVTIDNGIDVLTGLPYEDDTYDCVLFLDVFEHLRDHEVALAHTQRVLKPGGLLVICSPNICNISSRLHFIATGFFKIRRSFIGYGMSMDKSFAYHNHCPHLPVLLYQMNALGMGAIRFESVGAKLKSILFALWYYGYIWFSTKYRTGRQEKHLAGTEAGELLHEILTSWACLVGEAMIVAGRKTESNETGLWGSSNQELPAWYQGESERAARAAKSGQA